MDVLPTDTEVLTLRRKVSQLEQTIRHLEQLEVEVATSEERYARLLAALDAGVVLQDRHGVILTANQRAADILGIPLTHLIGRTSLDPRWQAIYPDGTPFSGAAHPAMVCLRTGQPQADVLMGLAHPASETTWLTINAQPIYQAGEPQPAMVVTSFTDVTDHQRRQDQLQILEALVAASTDFIGMATLTGQVTYLNPAARQILHLPVDRALGALTFWDIVVPADHRHVRETVIPTVLRAGSWQGQLRYVGIAAPVPMQASVFLVCHPRTGHPYALATVSQDVTERQHLEMALRAERDFAQQVMATMGQGLAVTNDADQFIYVNPAYAQLVGLPAEALLGRSPTEFVDPADHASVLAAQAARHEGQLTSYETTLAAPDGTAVPVLITGAPRRVDGPFAGAIKVVTDLRAHKRMEQEREDLLAQVQSLLARTDALYYIAHTMLSNQPLAHQLRAIVERTVSVFQADRVALLTVDQATETVTSMIGAGPGADHIVDVSYEECQRGLTGWVLRTQQVALSATAPDTREAVDVQQRRQATLCGAIMVAPVTAQGTCLGTLTAINLPDQPIWTRADGDLLLAIGQQLASALLHARMVAEMQHAAMTDALTGVYNRRGWEAQAHAAWETARRQQHPLAAMLVDVDYFKTIN